MTTAPRIDNLYGGFTGLNSVTNAGYTFTTTDNYGTVCVSAGTSNRTVVLPPGTSSSGRKIVIKKTDSGVGTVILSSAGAETLDGYTLSGNGYYLTAQYAWVTVQCDGTNWFVVETGGDYLTIAGSSTNILSTSATVASATFSVGRWRFSGYLDTSESGGTSSTIGYVGALISTTNNGFDTGSPKLVWSNYWASQSPNVAVPVRTLNLTTPTSVYMVGGSGFFAAAPASFSAGTLSYMTAERVR